jgi:hypothetical protein
MGAPGPRHGRGETMIRATSCGSFVGTRRHGEQAPDSCRTPGCAKRPAAGRSFCASCCERLDRIRAEFEAESESGEARRRMIRRSTIGLKSGGFD